MDNQLKARFQTAVAEKHVPGIGAFLLGADGKFVYNEAFGTNDINDPAAPAFNFDTPLSLLSCTKLITVIAALQLMEAGKLALSDPVSKYLPRINDIQVLRGFNGNVPILSKPSCPVTVRDLLAHTSGFTYDFLDGPTLRWRLTTSTPPAGYINPSGWADFSTPLADDPGKKYFYGISIDWLGFVVEAISGLRLDAYIDQNIVKPLGLTKTGISHPDPNRLWIHFRDGNGGLAANKAFENNANPEVVGGGGYLYSTLNDFAKVLGTVLLEGKSPQTGKRILQTSTVRDYLYKDYIPKNADRSLVGEIITVNEILTNNGTFIPTVPKDKRGWGAFLLNDKDLPRGRKKGSGAWAGLANIFYWVDPTSKKAGLVGSQILPFMDRSVLELFDAVERNAYGFPLGNGDADGLANYKLPPA